MTEPSLSLRHVRITNSGKLSDRYVTAQAKVSSDPTASDRGQIFAIVEIENPWFPTSQIGQTMINTVAREYYRAAGTDRLADFESALKKVNETLGHLAQTGETEWIGHLHAALILVREAEIHIASVGTAQGWLVRGGKVTAALENTSAPPPAEKTFATVLSGTIESGDRFIFASSGLLQVISRPELDANVFAAREFDTAALRLCNLLRSKHGQWVNAIMISADPARLPAPRLTIPDVLYLDAGGAGDWRLATQSWLQNAHRGLIGLGNRLRRVDLTIDKTMRRSVIPRSKQHVRRLRDWTSHQLKQWQERRVTQPIAPPPASPITAAPTSVHTGAESLIGKPVYSIHDYQAAAAATIHPTLPFTPEPDPSQLIRTYPQNVSHQANALVGSVLGGFRRFPRAIGTLPAWRSSGLVFGAVALVLLAVLVWNVRAISIRSQERQTIEQATETLRTLEDSLEEAKLAKIFNQPDKARDLFTTILTQAEALATSPVSDQAQSVHDAAETELDALTTTTRLKNLTPLADVGSSSIQMARWGDLLTVLDPSTQQLASLPLSGGEATTLEVPGGEAGTALGAYDEKVGAVLLTDTPGAHELTNASGPLTALTAPDGWKRGLALAPFFNNLYVLSPGDKQIWKFPSTNGQLGKAEAYVTDGTDVSAGVDLTIDGSVYVLTSNGEILKFGRGKREELAVRDIPKPNETLTAPRQIETTRDGDRLYVLDGTRIVALDKTGRFQAQYVPDGLETIQAFDLDEASKQLTVLSNGKILRATLP